jgi:hypothetical protein
MNDVNQDILQEIQRLGGRFDRMEIRLESIDTEQSIDIDVRLGAIESRLGIESAP